jgi:hypothetical protein
MAIIPNEWYRSCCDIEKDLRSPSGRAYSRVSPVVWPVSWRLSNCARHNFSRAKLSSVKYTTAQSLARQRLTIDISCSSALLQIGHQRRVHEISRTGLERMGGEQFSTAVLPRGVAFYRRAHTQIVKA